jgi:hypothetical protein
VTFAFDEARLRFAFDDEWRVMKWDRHPAYAGGIQKLPGTKAVDFVGIRHSVPWFIEVTDFREHRIETKHQFMTGQLVDEVACKVRDTLAGLVWSCGRLPHDERLLAQLAGALVNRNEKVPVVVWLEGDRVPDPAQRSTLKREIERRLAWLNPKVLVTCRSLAEEKPLPGLLVTSLPRTSN